MQILGSATRSLDYSMLATPYQSQCHVGHKPSSSLSFLDLPAEIRLNIYSHLIPNPTTGSIKIAICTSSVGRTHATYGKKTSPTHLLRQHEHFNASPILQQTLIIESLIRTYGIHLMNLPSSQIRSEVHQCLSRATTTFHCPDCFDTFLRHFSFGFSPDTGTGRTSLSWLRHVQIYVDVDRWTASVEGKRLVEPIMQHITASWNGFPTPSITNNLRPTRVLHTPTAMTNDMARTITREELKFALRTAELYTGSLASSVYSGWHWTYEPAEPETEVEIQGSALGWFTHFRSAYVKTWIIQGVVPLPVTCEDEEGRDPIVKSDRSRMNAAQYEKWPLPSPARSTSGNSNVGQRVNLMKSRFSPD